MAHSIESRLPFMDYRLVELAFNLPDRLKLRDGYTKYVLRRAMWDKLPERIVRNRVKQRFAAPYAQWFRGAWRPMIEDLLLSNSPHVAPYVRLSEFRTKLHAYLAGRDDAMPAATLWRILNTELWLRACRV
jgi:asparagine synthase (glutamine-hydrolysing)